MGSTGFRIRAPHLAAAFLAGSLLIAAASACGDLSAEQSARSGRSAPGVWITLLHTNDIHGEYRARPRDGVEGAPLAGGFLALAGTVARIREEATTPVVLVDAGDLMAGTPITGIIRQGARGGGAMELMNAVGYDAMALGNHEFDFGRENCRRLIGLARFPVLCANLIEGETGKPFAPLNHFVFEQSGVRIAIIGLILDELATVVATEPIAGLEVRATAEAARAEVAVLDPVSDVIIVVTHQPLDACRRLARAVRGIDIIVAGHDHKRTQKPIAEAGVLIVEAGQRLERLGRLDFRVTGDRVVEHRYQLLELPAEAGEAAPPALTSLYREIEDAIEADYGQVVGHLAVPFVRNNEAESNLGNWVTDVMREAAEADFAVTNSSGLRTSVEAGPLTRGEIYSISPFPNVLATFNANGAQLLAFARKNARDALGRENSIVQVSGLSYAYDAEGEVHDLRVGGEPVDRERDYLGASTDYLLFSQPGKYLGFVPEERHITSHSIFDLMCEAAARAGPIAVHVEGRMRALDRPPENGTRHGACSPEALQHAAAVVVPQLHTLDAGALDRLLAELPERLPSFEDRLRALALARLGAPYALGTLGEGGGEDPDPVFRVDEADCTVLVLTTVALAHGRSTAEAERWMAPAGYRRRGASYPVAYRNRLHFTSDRIVSSPLFADITAEVARSEELETVHVTLNRQESGKELLRLGGWKRELTLSYVPSSHLAEVLGRAPDLCGIAFVRLANVPRGFVIAHEGFLLDGRFLLHASSETGVVALVDVLDYLLRPGDPDPARAGRPRFDGAVLYGFRQGEADEVEAE